MIDLLTETLIPIREVPKLLPDRPSLPTIWRWRNKGARGRRLESCVLGGKVYTSREALQRFAQQQGGNDSPIVRTSKQRERAIVRAEKELADAGI